MFFGDCMKMREDFALNFGYKRTGGCILTHHLTLPFSPIIFLTRNDVTVLSIHPTFMVPRLKIKLKGRHFDTIEVIDAKSQAVLNTLTNHDFQDVFKNDKSAENGAYAEGYYF
jgi:hypothetical protein